MSTLLPRMLNRRMPNLCMDFPGIASGIALTRDHAATLHPAVSGVGLFALAMLGTARCARIR